jgi:ribonuclease HII
MMEIDNHVDPLYYFAKNKGYGTLAHRKALQELGATPYHRDTFLSRIL